MSVELGVDYAYGRLPAAALHAAGIRFVCRYLSPDPAKNLSDSERDELHAAGVAIVLVWESSAQRALGGKVQGREDARAASNLAAELCVPAGVPIYFAVDFDPAVSQMDAIVAYFRGVRELLGVTRAGVYGSASVVEAVRRETGVRYGWQTLAWSAGRISEDAQLYQFSNGHVVAGVSVDFDHALRADYGGWMPPPPHRRHLLGRAGAIVDVDLADGRWRIKRRLVGHRADRWDVEPLPAEGEYWCAKVRVHRGRPG